MAIRDKAMADKFGEMDRCMRVCGLITWLMAKVDSFIQVGMSMKDNGSMIRHKGRVSICIKMELHTLGSG